MSLFRRRKTSSLERLSLHSYVFHALGYEEKPHEAFLESGRSPARAMASPSDDLRSIVKARAYTKQNGTERYMGQEPNGKAAENGKRNERKIPFYETKLHDIGDVFFTPTVIRLHACEQQQIASGNFLQNYFFTPITCSV